MSNQSYDTDHYSKDLLDESKTAAAAALELCCFGVADESQTFLRLSQVTFRLCARLCAASK